MKKITVRQFSHSQLDKLGERLRKAELSGEDLLLLDEYRRSFSDGYAHVVEIIRDKLQLEPTGRPAKSTTSIRDKLKRESIRLSQMQDIAGCRIIVPDILAQNQLVNALIAQLGEMKIFDRREQPSNGYRAVHLIAHCGDKPIEIQVRSVLQHMWAELSEKAADMVDPAVKYGGGPEEWRTELVELSKIVAREEQLQITLQDFTDIAREFRDIPPDIADGLIDLHKSIMEENIELQNKLKRLVAGILK